ncbi:DJ-1 family glyoxalase III [Draconibacterium halophilum]|uniref:DJ-1/PfpI family protein n=1 Tax=Draconibacterium halophilum TaxID=2706887 RepID=A0A6C0RBL8_9BACT|nr:DJ-1 family glyoxalase III [Draconibacterium halophilum]QIA07457.1 DJ-1/PfpI family protein [Draconibacterium halophilum]
MKKIAVHLADGFEEIEAISIIDVLRRAEFDVDVVSMNKSMEVNGAHDITVKADTMFEDLDYTNIDMIVLPGGVSGARNLQAHEGLQKQILDFHASDKPLGAICAAPLVFGNLGLLEGKTATCYPGFESELKGAEISENTVVQSGTIVTGKGAGVAIHFALKIVEMFKGKEVADDLGKKMIVV